MNLNPTLALTEEASAALHPSRDGVPPNGRKPSPKMTHGYGQCQIGLSLQPLMNRWDCKHQWSAVPLQAHRHHSRCCSTKDTSSSGTHPPCPKDPLRHHVPLAVEMKRVGAHQSLRARFPSACQRRCSVINLSGRRCVRTA